MLPQKIRKKTFKSASFLPIPNARKQSRLRFTPKKYIMQNTVTSFKPESNSLGSYRKEKHGLYRQYMLLDLDSQPYTLTDGSLTHSAPVIIRVYWPASAAYACVWISTKDAYAVGKGKAGGYGYCKESAAIDSALRDAGIELEHSICGVGESAIRGALVAIARFMGLTNWTITVAHA